MNRRERLELEVSNIQSKIDNAPKDIPSHILDSWRKDIVSLEFELNNLVDSEEDNLSLIHI